jgi:hypothetical protein
LIIHFSHTFDGGDPVGQGEQRRAAQTGQASNNGTLGNNLSTCGFFTVVSS